MLLLVLSALAADDPAVLAREAIQAHPGVVALSAQADALRHTAAISDLWADPTVRLEYSNVPLNAPGLGNHPVSGVQLQLVQPLPSPGAMPLREDVADAGVAIAEQRILVAVRDLEEQVHIGFWRLTLTRELTELTTRHVQRADELLDAVRSRYEVGDSGQSTLLRLEVLRNRLADELLDHAAVEQALVAALAQTVGRSEFETGPLDAVAPTGNPETWLEAAQDHPALVQLRLEAEKAERAADLAVAEARPQVSVWAGYRVRTLQADDTDLVSIGLGAPLPRNQGRRSHAGAAACMDQAYAARMQEEALLDAFEAELTQAHAAWTRASDRHIHWSTVLVPGGEAALEAALSDYRVGKAEFSVLYDAEAVLLELERGLLVAAAETHIQAARVAALTGGGL